MDNRFKMEFVKVENGYEFWQGVDDKAPFKPMYLIRQVRSAPHSGYTDKDYIERMKGQKF